jgi:PAS domain S-box-containing protein
MLLHPHVAGIKIQEYDTGYTHKVGVVEEEVDERDIVLQNPVVYDAPTGSEIIGSLAIVSQVAKIDEALWEDFVRDFLLTLFLVVSIVLSAFVAYRYTIGIPLNFFLQGIKEAKGKRRAQTVYWESEDELGEVIGAYNNLLKSLMASEQRFKSLAANLPGAVFQLRQTQEGRRIFSYVSEGVQELLGVSSKEMMEEKQAFDFLPSQQREKLMHQLTSSISTSKPFDFEVHLELPAAESKWVRFLSRPHKDLDGTIVFDGIMLDVTEQKIAEQERNDMEVQLRQSQKMEAIGRLAGGIAHDFNNLIQVISGNIQLMFAKDLVRKERYLREADQACNRASQLVKHLLTFSRKVEISFQEMDINRLVQNTVQLLERTLPKNITLQTKLDSKVKQIHADPNQLEQVLMNLANNAKDAMPEGGNLVFSTEMISVEDSFKARSLDIESGEYVLITASDTGKGIDEVTQRQIFEPFFTTKEVGKGTGLGLATAYGIVKGHGGHMTCYSEPGLGTSFKLYIPATPKEINKTNTESRASHTTPTGSENILVVDDEENILEMTSEVLIDYGYTVYTAQSGEEALEVCQTQELELIILDLGMPGIGGEGFLKKIRELDPKIKVIITSGYANHKLAKEPKKYGAAQFLSKPYRFRELLNEIRTVLDDAIAKNHFYNSKGQKTEDS